MRNLRVVLLLLCFWSTTAKSSHIMGGYMHYTYLGNSKFRIYSHIFRDCRGISLSSGYPSFGVYAGTNGGNGCSGGSISFTRTSISDITPVCSTGSKPCYPANTGGTGEGVEEHIYEATVDFSTTPYSNYTGKNSCCEVTFYTYVQTNCPITGNCPSDIIFKIAINICNLKKVPVKNGLNNSVIFTNKPRNFLCCNQAFYFSPGPIDTSDHDSLSAKLVNQIGSLPAGSANYSSPFTYQYPTTPYCSPATTIKCTPNPKSNPPKGFYFDTVTSEIIYTPTKCDEVAFIAFQVNEYRQDSSGNWLFIGYTHYLMEVIVRDDCGYNNAPKIDGPKYSAVCEGDKICFDITSTDETFTPNQSTPDTIKLSWDKAIPNATFKLKDSSAREKKAEFCWQTQSGDFTGVSRRFTVIASDQHCGKTVLSSKHFIVKVNKKSKGKIKVEKGLCGNLILKATPDSNFYGKPSYSWKVKKDSSNISYSTKSQTDTLKSLQKGRYFISLKLSGIGGCDANYYDTVTMGDQPQTNLGNDTFCCKFSDFTSTPKYIKFAKYPYTYKWFINDTFTTTDTNTNHTLKLFSADTKVALEVTDSNQCQIKDTIKILLKPLPLVDLGADIYTCTYQAKTLDAGHADSVLYKWNTGETTRTIQVHKTNVYTAWITEKTYNCTGLDSVHLIVNDTVKSMAGADQSVCPNNLVQLNGQWQPALKPTVQFWKYIETGDRVSNLKSYTFTGINNAPNGSAAKTYHYAFYVKISEHGIVCEDWDTVKIIVNSRPVVKWQSDTLPARCYSMGDADLPSFIQSPVKNLIKNSNTFIYSSNKYYNGQPLIQSKNDSFIYKISHINPRDLQYNNAFIDYLKFIYTDSNSCTDSANTMLILNGTPEIISQDKTLCQAEDSITLETLIAKPATESWLTRKWEVISWPSTSDINNQFNANTYPHTLHFGPYTNANLQGEYSFRLHITNNNTLCAAEDTIHINVIHNPVIEYTGPQNYCSKNPTLNLQKLVLTDGKTSTKPGTVIAAKLVDGDKTHPALRDTSIFNGIQFHPDRQTGIWQFTILSENQGCFSTEKINLNVLKSPKANFITNPKIADKSFPQFITQNNSTSFSDDTLMYFWNFGMGSGTDTSTKKQPTIIYPNQVGSYVCTLIAKSKNGCSDTARQTLLVTDSTASVHRFLAEGNEFDISNTLLVTGKDIKNIQKAAFDASGKMVFSATHNSETNLPAGIYFIRLNIELSNGKKISLGKKMVIE